MWMPIISILNWRCENGSYFLFPCVSMRWADRKLLQLVGWSLDIITAQNCWIVDMYLNSNWELFFHVCSLVWRGRLLGSGTAKTVGRSRLVVPTHSSKLTFRNPLHILQLEQNSITVAEMIYSWCRESIILCNMPIHDCHVSLPHAWNVGSNMFQVFLWD
jgi:hypothetical protein